MFEPPLTKSNTASVLVNFSLNLHTRKYPYTFIYTLHTPNIPLPHVWSIRQFLTQTIGQWMCLLCSGALALSRPSVLTLSLSHTHTHTHTHSLTHTNSKDKHNQLFKTLVLAHVFFSYYFCSVVSIASSGNLTARRPDE